jgi:hypothetical protein
MDKEELPVDFINQMKSILNEKEIPHFLQAITHSSSVTGIRINKTKEEENSNNNNNNGKETNLCLISNNELMVNYVKLDCDHCFNYISLYNEIFTQKYKNIHNNNNNNNNNINNYSKNHSHPLCIKCPYCRKYQSNLLPPLEDEQNNISLIYGINTNDTFYKIRKNAIGNFVYTNSIIPIEGQCAFIPTNDKDNENENNDNICTNTLVLYNKELKKTYCLCHNNIVKKQIIKEKKRMEFLKNKEEKQKIKEDLRKNIPKCSQILSLGKNKGNQCSCILYKENFCKRHYNLNMNKS